MALARGRRDRGIDYWPGFVDALSTLVLSVIFILSIFSVVQFYLAQEISGKDTVLGRLQAQIAQLTELLSLEQTGRAELEELMSTFRATLSATEAERDRYKSIAEGAGKNGGAGTMQALTDQLEQEKLLSARAMSQVELLNQQILALRRQLGALESALEASEKKERESQTRITDLGQRLNVALAQRVQELSQYRSEFFGRLRSILGNRPDVRIVGDRFVFQSEVFFDAGQAVLKPEGQTEIAKIATLLLELEKQIPKDIAWVLRVDGHTDIRPIASAQFPSNWELSAARAIAVVQYLISRGVSPQRLVAAGFGEFQPIDPGKSEEAFNRNRRIELKLTER